MWAQGKNQYNIHTSFGIPDRKSRGYLSLIGSRGKTRGVVVVSGLDPAALSFLLGCEANTNHGICRNRIFRFDIRDNFEAKRIIGSTRRTECISF